MSVVRAPLARRTKQLPDHCWLDPEASGRVGQPLQVIAIQCHVGGSATVTGAVRGMLASPVKLEAWWAGVFTPFDNHTAARDRHRVGVEHAGTGGRIATGDIRCGDL